MKKVISGSLIFLGFLALLASGSSALSVTKQSSAEFNVSGASFEAVQITGDAVGLKISGGAIWTENGVMVVSSPRASKDMYGQEIVSDDAGGALLAYLDETNGRGEIYAARVNNLGLLSWVGTVETGFSTIEADPPHCVKSTSTIGICDGLIVAARGPDDDNIYVTKFSPGGTKIWRTAVCTAECSQLDPRLASDGAGGAVITWMDSRSAAPGIYIQQVNAAGNIVWALNGVRVAAITTAVTTPRIVRDGIDGYIIAYASPASFLYNDIRVLRIESGTSEAAWNILPTLNPSASNRRHFSLASMPAGEKGAVIAFSDEGTGMQLAQYILPKPKGIFDASIIRAWGPNGIQLTTTTSFFTFGAPQVSCQSTGRSIFSWLSAASTTEFSGYMQCLNVSGEVLWGSDGKSTGDIANFYTDSDSAFNIYAFAAKIALISGSNLTALAMGNKFDLSGNNLWDPAGVQVSPYPLAFEGGGGFAAQDEGGIVSWVDTRYGKKSIFLQKVVDLYYTNGNYVTEKIEAPDTQFKVWGNITWEVAGTASLITAEVKTGTSGPDLDTRPWQIATNGGSITSNGRWIQARIYINPASDRRSAPTLTSLSLNYSIDTSFPLVESVKVDGKSIVSGDYVPSSFEVRSVLTDDFKLAAADIKVDDSSLGYSTVSATDTRWEIKGSTPAPLSVGTHVLKVEAQDSSGNKTTSTSNIVVQPPPALQRVSAAVVRTGGTSQAVIGFSLTGTADTIIEIRSITGQLVKRIGFTGTSGYNAVTWDMKNETGETIGNGVYLIAVSGAGLTPQVGKLTVSE